MPDHDAQDYTPGDSSIAVVEAACRGDEAAFGKLFRAHYPRIHRTCFGLLGNDADAAEAAQQCFIKAWQKRDRFDFSSAYTTWLHRIAVNTCLDQLRRRRRFRDRFLSLFQREGTDATANMPAPTDPAAAAEVPDNARILRDALAALPEAQRTVLVLREFEQYSYEEIAQQLGIPVGTVMSRLHHARKTLLNSRPSDTV